MKGKLFDEGSERADMSIDNVYVSVYSEVCYNFV